MRRAILLGCGMVAFAIPAYRQPDRSAGPEPAGISESVADMAGLARTQPDSLRDQFARALRFAAGAETDSGRAGGMAMARALARAYAAAWGDSFLVRRLTRFEAASRDRRRDIAAADSLWRAGRVAFGQEGVPAAIQLWRESLRHATAADDPAGRTAAIGTIGAGFYSAGELDSATFYLTEAHRLAGAIGDYRSLGNALSNLASVSRDRGELARAAELYDEATGVRTRIGDSRGMASDQNNLGLLAWELGDLDEARRAFERALDLNRAHGADRYVALNLTNLGDLASLGGDYTAAEASYEEALALNDAAGDVAEMAFVLHDLGLLATRRGEYRNAVSTLSRALEIHEQTGALLEAVSVRSDLAAVQAATGDLERAIATLGRAQGDAAAAPPGLQAELALAEADLEVQLGRLAEADSKYARAVRLYEEEGDNAGVAEAVQGRGMLLLLREDHAGALRLLELAARGQESSGDLRAAGLTRLLAGEVQREMGDTATARETLTAARHTFTTLGDIAGEVAALSALGDLAVQLNAPLAAESWYRLGLARLGERPLPDLRWRLHAGLGDAQRSRGALAEAAVQLRLAVSAIEDVVSALRVEERHAGYLSDKWRVYASLALVEQARGRAAEAFAVSERMRGRQMLAMLARGRVRARHEASDREQDLRRRIGELTNEIEAAGSEAGDRREPMLAQRSVDAAREALDATQKAYADLLLELRESDPEYADLVSAEPVDWRSVARRLKPDEIFLQYLLTESASTVFVVTDDTVEALDLGIRRAELANLVDFARRAMDRPEGSTLSSLGRAPLRRLHHHLIEPVERAGYLVGRRTLVIIPHAELHLLPFGALRASDPLDRFLVERFDLVYAPSASAWARLGERVAPKRAPSVLALAPHTARLPGSAAEVASIRAVYGRRATVLTDAAASERLLRATARRHDILHLATFGVLNKHNPLFSYVELAPGDDGDGRLEVHEVFDLDLDGQLVVLSACQTALASGALADIPAGDDWVGLMQAFLQAGAGRVIASLWPVEDRATARLMGRFYRRLAAGQSTAVSLAGAQRDVLREPGLAHPFYWAGFVLTGTS